MIVKYVGTIIVLLIVLAVYVIKMNKEERIKHRYILFTSIGFGLMALPSWFIKNETILSMLSVFSIIFVVIGLYLYLKMRKEERKQKKH